MSGAPRTASEASSPAPNELLLRVRFEETDMMGIVHHSRYWAWFEEARFAFMERVLAVTVAELRAQAVYMPVVDSRCSYLRSVTWSERLAVRVLMQATQGPRFCFYYELRNAQQGFCAARAATRHVFTSAEMGLKLRVPDLYVARWAQAVCAHPEAFTERPPQGFRGTWP